MFYELLETRERPPELATGLTLDKTLKEATLAPEGPTAEREPGALAGHRLGHSPSTARCATLSSPVPGAWQVVSIAFPEENLAVQRGKERIRLLGDET